tara:strand:+ start:2548 stop:2745 length:198 start_codon:yes stop_codon:yes gene_type:complete
MDLITVIIILGLALFLVFCKHKSDEIINAAPYYGNKIYSQAPEPEELLQLERPEAMELFYGKLKD